MLTAWLIVKELFVRNENCARSIVINYNKFRSTLEVEIWALCYWGHNEGELLQKIVFFFKAALPSANSGGVGHIFHVLKSIQWFLQINNWRWFIFSPEFLLFSILKIFLV